MCNHSSTLISGCCSRSETLGVLVCLFTLECFGSSSSSKLLNSGILCMKTQWKCSFCCTFSYLKHFTFATRNKTNAYIFSFTIFFFYFNMINWSLYHPVLWDIINRNHQTLMLENVVPDALLLVFTVKSFKKLKLQSKNTKRYKTVPNKMQLEI